MSWPPDSVRDALDFLYRRISVPEGVEFKIEIGEDIAPAEDDASTPVSVRYDTLTPNYFYVSFESGVWKKVQLVVP